MNYVGAVVPRLDQLKQRIARNSVQSFYNLSRRQQFHKIESLTAAQCSGSQYCFSN